MSKKRAHERTGTPGSRPRHTKGGDCLGISPPSLKGRESKEANETGHMQDLKPKNIKKKHEKTPKMLPKACQNERQNLVKSCVGTLLGPLWVLLEPLGRLLGSSGKKPPKNPIFLKSTWDPKSNKNRKKSMLKKNLF